MAATDLLSLAEAKDAMRIPTTDTTRDATLAGTYIPAITSVVEDVVGPVVHRTVTHTSRGDVPSILLHALPIASITSVVVDGLALTAGTGYVVDLANGIVYAGSASSRSTFAGGIGSVVVTYVAGVCATTAEVPENVKLAARMILADQWTGSDQQGARPEFGGGGEAQTSRTPSGHLIPSEAYSLLEPDAVDYLGFS